MNHGDYGHGGHGGKDARKYSVAKTTLSPREDELMGAVIGCAIAVHRALGAGFLESIYQRALAVELRVQGLAFEQQRSVRVVYRGVEIPGQRIDLIVEKLVVVELKAIRRFDDIHVAQVISYLKTTGLRAALLINFRAPVLYKGIRRVVL